jgi:hypothetical protein
MDVEQGLLDEFAHTGSLTRVSKSDAASATMWNTARTNRE